MSSCGAANERQERSEHEQLCNPIQNGGCGKVQVCRPSCGRGRQESKRTNELVKDRESVPCELGNERLHCAKDLGTMPRKGLG